MVCSRKDCHNLKWMLWKNLQLLRRSKAQVILGLLVPLLFVGVLIGLRSGFPLKKQAQAQHLNEIYVTSSERNQQFADSSYSSQFVPTSCIQDKLVQIGLVKNPDIATSQTLLSEVLDDLNTQLGGLYEFKSKFFEDSESLNNYVKDSNYTGDSMLCYAIELKEFDIANNRFTIAIRTDSTYLPSTNDETYTTYIPSKWEANQLKYYTSGYLHVMSTITNNILRNLQSRNIEFNIAYMPMESSEYIYDPLDTGLQSLLSTIFLFCYLIPLILFTYYMADEKEKKLKPILKMTGLKESVYILSWYLCDSVRSSTLMVTLFSILTYFIQVIFQTMDVGSGTLWIQEKGLNIDSINETYRNFAFSNSLIMLTIDAFLYLAIAFYLQKIIPGEYGQKEKFYFCLSPEYWCRSRRRRQRRAIEEQDVEENLINQSSDQSLQQDEEDYVRKGIYERPLLGDMTQQDLSDTLRINQLRKLFGNKVAVDGITVSMFKGQIFALLGHNGAGKTTTIQMLTGLIQSNGGSASVFGIDIFKELDQLHSILGVCPQHDVLFDKLTVQQHLTLFANLKNVPAEQQDVQINKIIEDLGLNKKRTALAGTLSGGQKRRLSLALALVGDSKVVLLDEPTSGMDPTARRDIWDILKKYKQNKIIILTTHYMDEADVLGDRIAIMSHGEIKCCGSSLFLKNRFGVGYLLEVQKIDNNGSMEELTNLIKSYIDKQFKTYQDEAGNTVYQLPKQVSDIFKDFFSKLDSDLEYFNIKSYSLRVTTLEEVFIKIGEESEKSEQGQQQSIGNYIKKTELIDIEVDQPSQQRLQLQDVSIFTQIFKIWRRRSLVQRREKKLLILELIFPIVYLALGFFVSSINFTNDGKSLTLNDYTLYPNPMPVTYNSKAFTGATYDPKDFLNESYSDFSNSDYFQLNEINFVYTNFNETILNFDDYVTQSVLKGQSDIHYGNYFIYTLNDTHIETVIFNNASSVLAMPVFGNYMLQNIARNISGKSDLKLTFINEPLPLTVKQRSLTGVGQGIAMSVFIAIAYQMIAAAIVQSLVKEKSSKFKQQLFMSGTSVMGYWFGNYVQDLITHAIVQGFSFLFITLFKIDAPQVWVLFIMFAFANPPFLYFWTHLYQKDGPAGITIRLVFIFIGSTLALTAAILQYSEDTQTVGKSIAYIGMIVPIFSLTYGILLIANRPIFAAIKGGQLVNPLSFDCAGITIPYFIATTIFYWVLTILIEKGVCRKRTRNNKNDEIEKQNALHSQINEVDIDVEQEENRVKKEDCNDHIKVVNLSKTYITQTKQVQDEDDDNDKSEIQSKNKKEKKQTYVYKAVKDISFGVNKSECFVLLGINGAGKTTTFKCLIGEIAQSYGQISLDSQSCETYRNNIDKLKHLIGYCPQYDPITPQLTVYEHLTLIATLKGIKSDTISSYVETVMDQFTIKEFKNIQAQNLSGGNKRKLCAAMALVGEPLIMFLDEQSAGVDPASRRKMWKVIKNIAKHSAMIVTTHSMEEAEALGTKIGIMADGKFKCFGTAQHLKDKFGKGYEIQIKIDSEFVGQRQPQIQSRDDEKFVGNEPITDKERAIEVLFRVQQGTNTNLVEEFTENGIFKNFYFKLQNEGEIDHNHLVNAAYLQKEIQLIYIELENSFTEVIILDQSQDYAHFRVSKDQKSIGYMFAFVENLKDKYAIQEYSVSQTTLEQIFNAFAKESKYAGKKRGTTAKNYLAKKDIFQ